MTALFPEHLLSSLSSPQTPKLNLTPKVKVQVTKRKSTAALSKVKQLLVYLDNFSILSVCHEMKKIEKSLVYKVEVVESSLDGLSNGILSVLNYYL